MAGVLSCDGELFVTGSTPQCSGSWVLVQAPDQFDPSTLDPVSMAQAFGVGFFLICTPLAAIFGARAILKMIKG